MRWLDRVCYSPGRDAARQLGKLVRSEVPGLACGFRAALQVLSDSGQFRVSVTSGDNRLGTHSGLLSVRGDEFLILLDARPHHPERYVDANEAQRELYFRLCHEVGHTFFYERSGTLDRFLRLQPPGPEEELFCDMFAASLVVGPDSQRLPAANEILQLSLERQVPRWVTAMWLAREPQDSVAEWSRSGRLLWTIGDGLSVTLPDILASLSAGCISATAAKTEQGYLVSTGEETEDSGVSIGIQPSLLGSS